VPLGRADPPTQETVPGDRERAAEGPDRLVRSTIITLSQELLREINRRIDAKGRSRSDFIEEAVRAFLAGADRAALQVREATLLRKHAAALNAEMADVLEYQVLS